MREPLQRRSEASLERLLAATDGLVRRQGFQEASLNAICSEAGLTSGAFYARFGRKEDLALPLWRRYEPSAAKPVDAFAEVLQSGSLEEAVHALVLAIIEVYERDGMLIRELVSLARRHPDLAAEMRATNERLLQRLVDLIGEHRTGITHPNPGLALRLGLICIFNTLSELVLNRVIFEETQPLQPELLASEMTRILLSYLRS